MQAFLLAIPPFPGRVHVGARHAGELLKKVLRGGANNRSRTQSHVNRGWIDLIQ